MVVSVLWSAVGSLSEVSRHVLCFPKKISVPNIAKGDLEFLSLLPHLPPAETKASHTLFYGMLRMDPRASGMVGKYLTNFPSPQLTGSLDSLAHPQVSTLAEW